MYIVRNFDTPMRNVHLSYHDGSHYNSVRLIEDVADDIPQVINEDILKGVQQTSDMTTLLKIEEQTNEQLDNEEETKSKKIIMKKNKSRINTPLRELRSKTMMKNKRKGNIYLKF